MPERKITISDAHTVVSDVTGKTVAGIETPVLSTLFLGAQRPPIGVMAPAIRWVDAHGRSYLVERPPTYMTIAYSDTKAGRGASEATPSYIMPLPWVTYLLQFNDPNLGALTSLHLFARPEPVRSVDDQLYTLPLPNMLLGGFGANTLACLGRQYNKLFAEEMANKRRSNQFDASAACMSAINLFWDSEFNRDILIVTSAVPASLRELPSLVLDTGPYIDPKRWLDQMAKFSLEDVLRLDFTPVATVRDVLSIAENEDPRMYHSVADLVVSVIRTAKGK